ncbi:hypothetical protein AB0H45_17725 [Streptomyces atroolivaceus]|uniref:hypothetical protein n=1 Tax=Streptomyces atroolivaceus TaxID=66869 RepID=UPI000A8378DB|nr:hypothetical protein [Streptomyces atroolivaceus]
MLSVLFTADGDTEGRGTTTPGGRLVFHVFAAVVEFIREPIVQGTDEGLDVARAAAPDSAARRR